MGEDEGMISFAADHISPSCIALRICAKAAAQNTVADFGRY